MQTLELITQLILNRLRCEAQLREQQIDNPENDREPEAERKHDGGQPNPGRHLVKRADQKPTI